MKERDRDSTPNNKEDQEDDLGRECFTVPITLCRGQLYQASVDPQYIDV